LTGAGYRRNKAKNSATIAHTSVVVKWSIWNLTLPPSGRGTLPRRRGGNRLQDTVNMGSKGKDNKDKDSRDNRDMDTGTRNRLGIRSLRTPHWTGKNGDWGRSDYGGRNDD
jgi:hypothetical protein